MGVVAQEGIVITQQRVVDGVVGFGNEQVLVLDDYLQSHRENEPSPRRKTNKHAVVLVFFLKSLQNSVKNCPSAS